jgi:hypothetical protein
MITKEVYVSRVRDFLHEIARLNKKAARIGVAQIVADHLGKVTKTRTEVAKLEGEEEVRTFPVDVEHYRLTLPEVNCQWEAIVKITPTDEGAFAEPMPAGTQADADRGRSLDPQNCDHCHTRRDRNISYVVRHKTDRRVLQLGRNCFEDYVGKDTLRALEFQSVVLINLGGDDEGFWGGGGWRGPVSTVALRDCVAYAEAMFREQGWTYAQRDEQGNVIGPESTNRYSGRRVRQSVEQQCPEDAKIMDRVTEPDWAAADAAIERMAETEVTDEFGTTLKNLAEYKWVPVKKASLAAYLGQFLRQIDRKAQEAALNGKRVYVGTVGQRAVFGPLTCVRCHSYETQFGWQNINVFEDADHNLLVWKTGSYSANVGDVVTLKGTVKEHNDYRGTKQTILSRCKEVAK